MNQISVLDCTLRDGGYVNKWLFGHENIKKIIAGLAAARIDIIECGFLTNAASYDIDKTLFCRVDQFANTAADIGSGSLFVCMANYGEYSAADLPDASNSPVVKGVRVAFHKKERSGAIEMCREIAEKGYKLFIQAMVSLSYTDDEFLALIREVNDFKPYAFYIVDSFGVMKSKDLMRLFYLVEHNLCSEVFIGFHSHNNMQLAYANAQTLANMQTSRKLIVDSSIYGMGRGAGNLNTELFVDYLNSTAGAAYVVNPLIKVIDEVLIKEYNANYWGYSLPNYLSAKYNAHPNYATYLDDKKTLTIEDMDRIFTMIGDSSRNSFDPGYIERLYLEYMEFGKAYESNLSEFRDAIAGKAILIIAPGQSVEAEKKKVTECAASGNTVSISVNFEYTHCDTDYIFVSNRRRSNEGLAGKHNKMIVTSNIETDKAFLKIKYADLLNGEDLVKDNACMMLIKYLIQLGAEQILLAGLDGYSHDAGQDYANPDMVVYKKNEVSDAMNTGLNKLIKGFSTQVCIKYITSPRYVFEPV